MNLEIIDKLEIIHRNDYDSKWFFVNKKGVQIFAKKTPVKLLCHRINDRIWILQIIINRQTDRCCHKIQQQYMCF